MLRRIVILVGALLVLGGVGVVVVVNELSDRIAASYRGYASAEILVDIDPGDSIQTIAERLAAAGVVRDNWTFRLAAWLSGRERELQAGEYHFEQALSAIEVVDTIVSGKVHLRPITFVEGWTIVEMARTFQDAAFGTAEAFLSAARRVELIEELDPTATDLEGYLFPETYSLPRGATADDLVEVMVAEFRQAFSVNLREEAERRRMTVRAVVTLASLIQKETGSLEEHQLVSAVYNNRLRIGMPLQCDPTVIYALQLADLYNGNLTRANLEFDSPYNTYRHAGLPPGPIASAGKAALQAALRPADVGYLYFVSRNDGTHAFANTLNEHNRNVRRFQVEYFRRQRSE